MAFLFLPDHTINIRERRGTVVEFLMLFTVITFFLNMKNQLSNQSVKADTTYHYGLSSVGKQGLGYLSTY